MKQQIGITFIMLCLAGLSSIDGYSQQPRPVTFYVATTGSSNNPGTIDQPFSRPEDARDAISKISGPVNATVYIRGGIYPFTKSFTLQQDGSDTTRRISFAAYQNEKVQFTGGVRLDAHTFQPVSDPAILNRLPASARGKVLVCSLKDAGITNYGKQVPHGYKIIRTAPLELFYNGTPLTVARYPNDGYMPIGTVSDPGSNPRQGDRSNRGAKFAFPDPHISNWSKADNAWVGGFFSYGYSDDYLKVDSFDLINKTIRLKQPGLYSVFSTDNTSNDILKNSQKMRGFYVYNLLEEIDTPGEWFLDETSGLLYVWPPDNAIAGADIEVSMLEDPIVVLTGTSNISFSGISFEYARGMGLVLNNTKNTTITHCSFDGLGTLGISAAAQPQGAGNRPGAGRNLSPGYNTGLTIESCSIGNTGTGGVILEGGDRQQLLPAHNVIDNCEIYNFSRLNRTYCPGISLNGVGNRITHCYIHDAPDEAIMFYGSDHTISFNHIKNVVTYMTDAGAVGTGRDIASTGNTIDDNFFDNINSAAGNSVCALYLDDGSSGMEVDGNIFYRSGTAGTYHFGAVHVNGGSDNNFRNNYFIDCPRGFSNSQWTDEKWRGFITDAGIAKTYRPGVDLNAAVYTKKYPWLARLTDSNTLATRRNYSFNTLAYNVDVFSVVASFVHTNSFITQQDPGFADLNKPDFTLTKTPPAFQNAADWKPVPFREIGIQNK